MTRDEFVLWDAPPPCRWQLIDGEPVEMAPASQIHSFIQSELIRLLGNHFVARDSPCRVVTAPGIVPRVRADMNFRVPDVGVTCSATSSADRTWPADPVLVRSDSSLALESIGFASPLRALYRTAGLTA